MKKMMLTLMGASFFVATAWAAENVERNSTLAENLQQRIANEMGTRGDTGILVESSGGWVVLRGTVSSKADRERAEKAVQEVPGVKSVDNRINVPMHSSRE